MRLRLRTPKELGAAIRGRRKSLGLDQATLAERARVSRVWINQVEGGKPGASVGLVLRTLAVLGLELHAEESKGSAATPKKAPDINAILARARGRP